MFKSRYGVEPGQIYTAADRSMCGHLVLSIKDYQNSSGDIVASDAVTIHFSASTIFPEDHKIDCFKLAMVRYALEMPNPNYPLWIPERIRDRAWVMRIHRDDKNLNDFKKEVESFIKEWYTSCPHSMPFVNKVIKSYTEKFGKVEIK